MNNKDSSVIRQQIIEAQGGRIYISTNDDGSVIDVPDSKKLLEDIPNKIQTTLGIVADVNLLSKEGEAYIEIVIILISRSFTNVQR